MMQRPGVRRGSCELVMTSANSGKKNCINTNIVFTPSSVHTVSGLDSHMCWGGQCYAGKAINISGLDNKLPIPCHLSTVD